MMYTLLKPIRHEQLKPTDCVAYANRKSLTCQTYWLSARLLFLFACAGSVTTITHAYNRDTIAAFFVPALLANYLSQKPTVADIRAKAQAMIDNYEQNNVIFTASDIRWAYGIVKASDKEIENRLWWNKIIKSSLVGACIALVYNNLMHPAKQGDIYNIYSHCNNCCSTHL